MGIMSKKSKIWIWVLSIIAVFVLAASLLIYQHVAINLPFSETPQGAVSVVFDKAAVLGADKVVLREGDKSLTITEPDKVRDIAGDFLVGNCSGLCGYHHDRWIDIYNGDKLVRQVHWNDHDDLAVVYKKDALHWLWPGNVAQVSLSSEDAEKYTELYSLVK